MNIQIQGRPETLYQCDDAGSGTALTGETSTVDEIGFDGSGNDPKRSRKDVWTAGIEKA